MRLMTAIGRLKSGFKARGFRYLMEAGLDHIPHELLYFDRFLLMCADRCDIPVRSYSGYEMKMLEPDDLDRIAGFTFPIAQARRELREGSVCLVVVKDRRAVSWRWGATGRLYVRYCNTVVDTGDDGYYSYGLETIPEERFRGHVNTCLKTMHGYFGSANRTLNYTLVSTGNGPNIKMHERCQFRTVGEIITLTVLGMHFCYYLKWPFHNRRFSLTLRTPPKGARPV
jgi:hypothetical protein